MPTNLCPYFWKSVWMYVAIIPYTLITLPMVIIEMFGIEKPDSAWQRVGFASLIYFFAFVGWAVVFVPYFGFTYGWTTDAIPFWDFLFKMGVTMWVLGILIGGAYLVKFIFKMLIYGVEHAVDSIKYSNETDALGRRKRKKNMVVEFIKAKYHKYCPNIEWEE